MKTFSKKLASVVIVMAMLVGVISVQALAAPQPGHIEGGSVQGAVGDYVDLTVYLSENPGVTRATFLVSFDFDALEAVSVTHHTDVLDDLVAISPPPSLFPLRMAFAVDLGSTNIFDAENTGALATVRFRILPGAPQGEYVTVSLTPITMSSLFNGDRLPHTTASNGSVFVAGGNGNSGSGPGPDDITVIVSFEGFNLGQGFYVEPTQVTVPQGTSVIGAARAALVLRGIEHSIQHNELSHLYGVNPNWNQPPNPPLYLEGRPFGPHGGPANSIGTGSYFIENQAPWSNQIQWRATVNHHLRWQGYEIVDGDVVRFIMGNTMRWPRDNCDLGLTPNYGGSTHPGAQPPLYVHANKTQLIRALFEDGADQNARQVALNVIINPLATPQQVADAITQLQGGGGSFLPGDINGDGIVNDLDLMALRLYLLGMDDNVVNFGALDVNEDGVVNDLDIMALRMIILGL